MHQLSFSSNQKIRFKFACLIIIGANLLSSCIKAPEFEGAAGAQLLEHESESVVLNLDLNWSNPNYVNISLFPAVLYVDYGSKVMGELELAKKVDLPSRKTTEVSVLVRADYLILLRSLLLGEDTLKFRGDFSYTVLGVKRKSSIDGPVKIYGIEASDLLSRSENPLFNFKGYKLNFDNLLNPSVDFDFALYNPFEKDLSASNINLRLSDKKDTLSSSLLRLDSLEIKSKKYANHVVKVELKSLVGSVNPLNYKSKFYELQLVVEMTISEKPISFSIDVKDLSLWE